jgi:uncharacterized Zn finger protein
MADRTREFLAVLESLGMAARFQQGRRLARAGAVQGLTVTTSVATANVRDADPDAADTHRVRIAVRAFSATEWHHVQAALAAQAIHVAKLLAGEVPDGLDSVLADLGLSLLPQSVSEVALSCSCRAWQEPCGHVIATWYALADEFERDPFTMFAWRGRGREELLDLVREPPSAVPAQAVPPAPGRFWVAGHRASRPPRPVGTRRPDAILDQLDPLHLAVGRHDVTDLIRPVYERIVDAGTERG